MALENLRENELLTVNAGGIITGPVINTEVLGGVLSSAWTIGSFTIGVLGGFADGLDDGLNHDDCEQE